MPHAQRRDVQPPAVQHGHGDLHAFAFFAQPVGDRHARILEDHVADIRALLAHLLLGLADGDARRVALHDERRQPLRPRRVRIRPRHHGEDRRLVGIGDVALRSVEHVVVAIAHGFRLCRSRIRSCIRLGQCKARNRFARRQLRQPVALLVVRAEHHDALAADADIGAEGRPKRRRRAPHLEDHQRLFLHGEPKPAIFFRDRQPEETEIAHLLHDAFPVSRWSRRQAARSAGKPR